MATGKGLEHKTGGSEKVIDLPSTPKHHNQRTTQPLDHAFTSASIGFPPRTNLLKQPHKAQAIRPQRLWLRLLIMCIYTTTAFRMCGHTEFREIQCELPPVIHMNGRRELCVRIPQYRRSAKNGICDQCRASRLEVSQAKTKPPHPDKQHDPVRAHNLRVSNGACGTRKQNGESVVGNLSAQDRIMDDLAAFRCRLVS